MPSSATRRRIEWCPGDAALEALEIGEELFSNLNRQALIDRLVITGLAAYTGRHWCPPPFLGTSRDCWSLPAELTEHKANPGNNRIRGAQISAFPGVVAGRDQPTIKSSERSSSHEPISDDEPDPANA